jgi:endonuclease/exonuclease/phosphatase family metal-dependent hydrolase
MLASEIIVAKDLRTLFWGTIDESKLPLLPTSFRSEHLTAMQVLTWNVLHRIHAEKYNEPSIHHWPDEAARVMAQFSYLQALFSRGLTVALLQEVGGDLLKKLRSDLSDHAVINHPYPRIPRARGATQAADPSEHLVVIAPQGAVIIQGTTASNDPGKGFLSVQVGEWRVISTHVSFGRAALRQLTTLRDFIQSDISPLLIGGDFNTDRQTVEAALGLPVLRPMPGSAPTRPRTEGGSDIDHLLVRPPAAMTSGSNFVQVLPHPDLSDHAPVLWVSALGAEYQDAITRKRLTIDSK